MFTCHIAQRLAMAPNSSSQGESDLVANCTNDVHRRIRHLLLSVTLERDDSNPFIFGVIEPETSYRRLVEVGVPSESGLRL